MTIRKKNIGFIIGCTLIVISLVGMIILKSKLEYQNTAFNETFFSFFRILFFGVLMFFLADWVFERWKEYRILKNEKAIAELVNLKNQISPHFFFNTLNNLYGLINKDTDKARDFVLKLSDLMRYSIYNTDIKKVALKEEISYIENFINLQEIRYNNIVDVIFKKDVYNDSISIHPLLLIVLVENAFKHGAETLTNNSFVHLSLKTETKKVIFSVENNYETENLILKGGIGLENLKKRLNLLYPQSHYFSSINENGIFKTQLELVL